MTDELFLIMDGVPAGFVELCWLSDYRRFGVSMGELYNPVTHQCGVSFKKGRPGSKGRLLKSIIILDPNPEINEATEAEARKAFLAIEAEFGIPVEASKYAVN